MNKSIVTRVIEQLQELPENLQRRVLDFVQRLKSTNEQGTPGGQLLQFAGSIPPEDLDSMQEALKEAREDIEMRRTLTLEELDKELGTTEESH